MDFNRKFQIASPNDLPPKISQLSSGEYATTTGVTSLVALNALFRKVPQLPGSGATKIGFCPLVFLRSTARRRFSEEAATHPTDSAIAFKGYGIGLCT